MKPVPILLWPCRVTLPLIPSSSPNTQPRFWVDEQTHDLMVHCDLQVEELMQTLHGTMVRIDDVVAGKLLTSRPSDQPRQSDQHRSEEFVPRILAVSKHPKQPNVTAKQPLKASPPAQTPTAQSALALASESTSQSDANIPAAVPAILIPGPWTRRPSLVASAQQLEPGSHAPSAPRPEVCAVHPNPATSSTSASPDSLTADQSSWSPLRRLSLATSPVSIGTGTDGVALVAMAALSEAEEQAESEKEKKLATMAAFFAEKPPPRRLSVDGGPSHAQAAPPQSGLSRQAVPIAGATVCV